LSFGFSIRLLNLNNNCVKNNKFCILSYEKVKRTKKLVTFLLLNRSSCLLWMHLHPNENCLNYFLWTIKHVFCMTIFCTCGLHLKLNFLRLMNIRNESNGKIKKFLPLQAFEILIWIILSSSSYNEYALAEREILFHSSIKYIYMHK
jgi:hypothetical protein